VKEEKVVKPDGSDGLFGTVDYQQGVSVVALNEQSEMYLIKEYYYVLEEDGIQTPSGGIDAGETPLVAAKRELLEEAGCVSDDWVSLGLLQPFTMIIKSPTHLFLAKNVIEHTEHSDSLVKPFKIPFKEAYQMVLDSKIYHAASAVAILKTKVWLEQQK
jgi:ADP-ribose pyrophosphatase